MGPSMLHKTEFKVGLFVLFTMFLIVSSILYVTYKKGFFETEHTYTLYTTSGEGLSEGMPVLFSGFKIGKVTNLELDDKGVVQIKISVTDRHAKWLRQNSQFTMVRPVIGTARINVYTENLTAPPLPDGSLSEVLVVDDINELINKAQPILAKLNQTVTNIEAVTGNLANQTGNINKIIGNAEKITTNFSDKKSIVEVVLGEEESVRAVHESVRHLESILKNTDEQVFSSAGTLPQLNAILKDILAKLEKLDITVDNINKISTNAADSTQDLKVLRSEIDATVAAVKSLSRKIDGILSSGKEKEIKLP
jgi:phospholipid/cholesterol/gamma-HCH transport system substrate-binding protein